MTIVKPTIRMDAADNVVNARCDLPAGTVCPEEGMTTVEEITGGYKVATKAIKAGESVIRYGIVIGHATQDIQPGECVHKHNLEQNEYKVENNFCEKYVPTVLAPESERPTFQGIVRKDGKVGTRNFIGVFSCSNCAAGVARKIAAKFGDEIKEKYPNVDGVVPFIIDFGCCMENSGDPMDTLRNVTGRIVRHQNMGGAVFISLGCERNNIKDLMESQGLEYSDTFKAFCIQEVGGSQRTIAAGVKAVEEMLPIVNQVQRVPCSVEHLTVALQCGGSDAFSGISCNPALGYAMDKLVRFGGSCIVAETTEIPGAEHTLTARAATPEVAQKLVDKVAWWFEYSKGKPTQINGATNPGNVKGGITTIPEKGMGVLRKGGTTALVDVLDYGETLTKPGFNFMDTPAFDPVSLTGEVAGGCNLSVFTTGRGSCFGSNPAPTTKLISNTPMFKKMEDDVDINCGTIVDGDKTLEEVGEEIFQFLIEVASGRKTKSELLGFGEEDFRIWWKGCIS